MADVIIHFSERLRWAFQHGAASFDLCRSTILIFYGIWFISGAASLSDPRVIEEMNGVFPLWIWGSVMILTGASLAIFTLLRYTSGIVGCYFVSFGLWTSLFWLQASHGTVSDSLFVCLVFAIFTMIRIINAGEPT